jgi:hypothetical protein
MLNVSAGPKSVTGPTQVFVVPVGGIANDGPLNANLQCGGPPLQWTVNGSACKFEITCKDC